MAARPCIFLDRDGTLVEDKGYVHRVEDLVVLPHVQAGLARLKTAGFLLIVVTNQSGVARGLYPESAVHAFHAALNQQLGAAAAIDAFYYCPYHVDGVVAEFARESPLRKPDIGMFEAARGDHEIDVELSYMIGDRELDVEFARRAGLRPVLLEGGATPRRAGLSDVKPALGHEAPSDAGPALCRDPASASLEPAAVMPRGAAPANKRSVLLARDMEDAAEQIFADAHS